MSTSSDSIEREMDEYQDVSHGSGGSSYESSSEGSTSSSDSSFLDKHYSSGVLGFPLKEFQEMKRRMASGVEASSSRRLSSPPQDKEDDENVIYSCALEVVSTLDTSKFKTFVGRYQIPSEFKPYLSEKGEWCCSPF